MGKIECQLMVLCMVIRSYGGSKSYMANYAEVFHFARNCEVNLDLKNDEGVRLKYAP